MAWTKEETKKYQMENSEHLRIVNESLRPDSGLSGKIGIFCPGQNGDIITAMSVLEYRDKIFPGKEIIWYCNTPNCDALMYAPISEVRPYPWAGNGLPEGTPDFYPLLCDSNNRLNMELAKDYELTADLEDGYFPTPWMVKPEARHGINYPVVSKRVFGVPDHLPWHPLLNFSEKERTAVDSWIAKDGPVILIETFAGSGQSKLTHDMVMSAMQMCYAESGGRCTFVFVSHKYLNGQEEFPEILFRDSVKFAKEFTVRQCALLANYCDLFISVSSGVSVASSYWENKQFPMLQYCGSAVCGTKELANGECVQVFSDDNPGAEQEFYESLKLLLTKYKIRKHE